MTNYELILGQTSFTFAFDYSTFGHVYLRDGYYDASTDTLPVQEIRHVVELS